MTLATIRNLTAVTDECKDRIVESGGVVIDEMARVLGGLGVRGGAGQVVLNGGDEEVEDVSFSFFSGRDFNRRNDLKGAPLLLWLWLRGCDGKERICGGPLLM